MYKQDYIPTWTDAEGNAFCADYVYASVSVFAKVESVEVIEVDGLAHKAIKVTLKYGHKGDYVMGANIAGFIKVADAMIAQGV